MKDNGRIEISKSSIDTLSELFLEKSRLNQFYDKNVFFTQNLKGFKYNQFQVIGNLGGHPTDTEFSTDTDFYIISDLIVEDLRRGLKNEQLTELENKINSKGKKHTKLKILTEKVFLRYVYERCSSINDQVTLNLIRELI
ncbi:MAG: hypothetical protein ACK4R6_05540 [Spirosomataceae bacterium]